jgi:SAM-dependent methyltransferase
VSGGPGRYRLPRDYIARADPLVDDDHQRQRADWPRSIYADAARLAEAAGAVTLVDLGCGSGDFLVEHADRFTLIGIDLGINIAGCLGRHPVGTWIEHDLSGDAPLPLARETLRRSAFVCVDVIEHLVRPEHLLAELQRSLAPGLPALVTTPDRELTHGPGQLGPPPNPEDAREWTLAEFGDLLADGGFAAAELRLVGEPVRRTILAVLRGA